MRAFFLLIINLAWLTLSGQNFNIAVRSNLPYPGQTLANIWGHVDSLGNEYALVGASQGLSVVNVTNPTLPFEVAQIAGPNNFWKEVKTWGKYAYIATEGGDGLQIVDLRNLPGTTLPSKFWTPTINGTVLSKIHALHIDNGFAYLYGSNIGGVLIVDLSDPWNPVYSGKWDDTYVHDGYVRNDTLYAGLMYMGSFGIIDVTDKGNPVLLQTQSTPNAFTHNTWLSDNSKILFTTDEKSNSFLAAYDISDINNITELDRFQTTPGSGAIVHNTHILNDYAVTSWYKDGVSIVDASRPQNLVEIARYDTYAGTGSGFSGAWGVYPYLPSKNLVVSNIDDGLFVLTPTYVKAAYLEGKVTDSISVSPINGVKVEIIGSASINESKITGEYATGIAYPATYSIRFSKTGYETRTITGVKLVSDSVTNLDVRLFNLNLGVSENLSLKEFKFFPNPTSGQINYEIAESLFPNSEIIITDLTGRIIRSYPINSRKGVINLSEFENGAYIIKLLNNEKIIGATSLIKID